jgi:predicted transcriptional regulator
LLASRTVIDIIFIVLAIAAVIITAIVLAKALTDHFSVKLEQSNQESEFERQILPDENFSLTIEDPDASMDSEAEADALAKERLAPAAEQVQSSFPEDIVTDSIYGSSHVILPITWGAVAGTLIWRGKIRSQWRKQGYDYDTFRLVAKMRGSPTRVRLLNLVLSEQKNKLQMARELDVDWKTVDNHIGMLMQTGLVEEKVAVGTTKYYSITENGKKILLLLADNGVAGEDYNKDQPR